MNADGIVHRNEECGGYGASASSRRILQPTICRTVSSPLSDRRIAVQFASHDGSGGPSRTPPKLPGLAASTNRAIGRTNVARDSLAPLAGRGSLCVETAKVVHPIALLQLRHLLNLSVLTFLRRNS